MGLPLGRLLCAQGVPVVAFNRTPARAELLSASGARIVSSPAEVARSVSLMLTVVTGPEDLREVLSGRAGVIGGARAGSIVVDLSTIDAVTSSELAEALRARGIEMLDAPMSGSVHDAEQGTLGLMVGGDAGVLVRARPVLSRIARHIHHFGPNGAGCTAKLALNGLVAAMAQSLAEALAFLERAGGSRALFLEALAASGLSSPLYSRVGQRALAQDFEARFALRLLHKDLGLLATSSRSLGVDLPLGDVVAKLVAARAAAHGERDYAFLVEAQRLTSGLPDSNA
ncbi:NAD(P)-dependent oxidoreductase [Myxococcus stipitatus]|nr:NAD(P)-dependent oxidoreductase [Myxococcus stipitatus]